MIVFFIFDTNDIPFSQSSHVMKALILIYTIFHVMKLFMWNVIFNANSNLVGILKKWNGWILWKKMYVHIIWFCSSFDNYSRFVGVVGADAEKCYLRGFRKEYFCIFGWFEEIGNLWWDGFCNCNFSETWKIIHFNFNHFLCIFLVKCTKSSIFCSWELARIVFRFLHDFVSNYWN